MHFLSMAFILKTILLLASITSLVTADVPVSFVVDHGLIDSSFALNPNTSLVKRETAYQQALRKGRDLWKELNGPQDQTPNRWATIAQLQVCWTAPPPNRDSADDTCRRLMDGDGRNPYIKISPAKIWKTMPGPEGH